MGPGCPLWSQNGQRCTLATICYQWPRDAGVWGTDRQRESIFHKEPLRSIREVNYCGSTCIISRCWVVFLSEKNYRSVAAAIYNTSTNNTAGIKYSLFWITCITAMHLWKPAMNSSNTVCLGFLFFFGLIDVLFYFLVLSFFLVVTFYFLLTCVESCYAGSRWSLNKWALSLLRKVLSDSDVLTLVGSSFHHWGARTEESLCLLSAMAEQLVLNGKQQGASGGHRGGESLVLAFPVFLSAPYGFPGCPQFFVSLSFKCDRLAPCCFDFGMDSTSTDA